MPTEKTAQEKVIEQIDARLKTFLSNCVTRDGSPFTVDTLQRNSSGMPVTLKGTVTVKNAIEGKEKTQTLEMFWNIDGKAISNSINIDLVTEEKIPKSKNSL